MKENKPLRVLVSFILLVNLIVITLSTFVNIVILDKNTYIEAMDKSGVYDKAVQSIYSKMDSSLGVKLDDSVKNVLITQDDIKNISEDVVSVLISDLKEGKYDKPSIDTSLYKKRLDDYVKNAASGSAVLQKGLSQVSDKAFSIINEELNNGVFNKVIQSDEFHKAASIVAFLHKTMIIAVIGLLIFIVVLYLVSGNVLNTVDSFSSVCIENGILFIMLFACGYLVSGLIGSSGSSYIYPVLGYVLKKLSLKLIIAGAVFLGAGFIVSKSVEFIQK